MRPAQKIETYPDGIVEIYKDNGRKLGELICSRHFENQSVGVNRYYQSVTSIAGDRVDRVIKVPHTNAIDRLNIAIIKTENGKQYRINRIQTKPERGVDLLELQSVQVTIKKEGTDESKGT